MPPQSQLYWRPWNVGAPPKHYGIPLCQFLNKPLTCAHARCIPPSYVIHHRITLMELYRCTNFHVASSKYLEVRGLPTCTCVARAQCTTRPQVMYQRITLVKLFQCTKFRVAGSKFPENKGAYAYAYKCTCIARALCTPSPKGMHHRITLIDFHKCTKFGVNR